MGATLTATCWPFSLTDDPKATLALSLAEDAAPETDPLIPALSPLAAIHTRATYRELKAAVGARDQDAILAVLFRFRSGQPACAASDDPAEFKGIRGLVRQVDNEGIRHDVPAYAHVEVIRAGQVVTP
jgi:hypothetical protein